MCSVKQIHTLACTHFNNYIFTSCMIYARMRYLRNAHLLWNVYYILDGFCLFAHIMHSILLYYIYSPHKFWVRTLFVCFSQEDIHIKRHATDGYIHMYMWLWSSKHAYSIEILSFTANLQMHDHSLGLSFSSTQSTSKTNSFVIPSTQHCNCLRNIILDEMRENETNSWWHNHEPNENEWWWQTH